MCQKNAGNHSYIFKIRKVRHFGYTKNKAQLSRLFPACALCLILLSSVVKYTLSDRFTQLSCEITFIVCHTCMWFYWYICIQVRVSLNVPTEEIYWSIFLLEYVNFIFMSKISEVMPKVLQGKNKTLKTYIYRHIRTCPRMPLFEHSSKLCSIKIRSQVAIQYLSKIFTAMSWSKQWDRTIKGPWGTQFVNSYLNSMQSNICYIADVEDQNDLGGMQLTNRKQPKPNLWNDKEVLWPHWPLLLTLDFFS